jgi:hypothetical protein
MADFNINVTGSIDPAAKSTGGNESADAGKLAVYNTEGQIQGSSNSSSLAAVKGTASGSGYGVHGESSSGTGVVGQSTTGNGVDAISNQKQAVSAINFHATEPVVKVKNANAANTADLAQFHRNNNQGLAIKNDGGLGWDSATGAATTRTGLALGTAATVDTGTGSANVPTVAQADARYLRITNAFTLVKKTSSTSRNNNTLTDDPDLFFPMEANTSYTFTITVYVQASAAGDFKSRVTGPAAPTSVFISQAGFGTTGMTPSNRIAQAYDSTDLTQVFTSNFLIRLIINGTVQNGANAGNLVFQWAQNTTSAGSPTLVLTGSTVEWSEI